MPLNFNAFVSLTALFGGAQAFDMETNHAFALSGENGELLTMVRDRFIPGDRELGEEGYSDYFTETYRRTCRSLQEISQEPVCTWIPWARSKPPALPAVPSHCQYPIWGWVLGFRV